MNSDLTFTMNVPTCVNRIVVITWVGDVQSDKLCHAAISKSPQALCILKKKVLILACQ